MDPFVVGFIISAIVSAYSAYQSSEASEAASKQSKYNAEANADAAAKAAEQEKLNRDATRRAESKALKRQRARIEAAYAKSGVSMEGTPEMMLAEQTAADEEWMQNQERISLARQKGLEVQGLRSLQEGRYTSRAYKNKAQSTLIAGAGQTAGQLGQAYYASSESQSPKDESESWMFKA